MNPDRIIINPTQWNHIGKYKVTITLTDTINSTSYNWNLEITNSAPYFSNG